MAGDSSGMIMFFMMFVAIAAGLYFFRDKLAGIMGGGAAAEELPPPEDMPAEGEGEGEGVGVYTRDLVECAGRCNDCDDVIDPNTGQVYWHAARSDDEKDCISCLKRKCGFLYPENKTIVKKYYETKIINKEAPRPEGSDRTSKEKSPRGSSNFARRIW